MGLSNYLVSLNYEDYSMRIRLVLEHTAEGAIWRILLETRIWDF